jgi:hypothetical protein
MGYHNYRVSPQLDMLRSTYMLINWCRHFRSNYFGRDLLGRWLAPIIISWLSPFIVFWIMSGLSMKRIITRLIGWLAIFRTVLILNKWRKCTLHFTYFIAYCFRTRGELILKKVAKEQMGRLKTIRIKINAAVGFSK